MQSNNTQGLFSLNQTIVFSMNDKLLSALLQSVPGSEVEGGISAACLTFALFE